MSKKRKPAGKQQQRSDSSSVAEKYASMMYQAPFAIALLEGENLLITAANDRMLQFCNKTSDIIGLPLTTVLPELQGQEFEKVLIDVLRSQKSFTGKETPARLTGSGSSEISYFDVTFTPLKNEDDEVREVMVVAKEVTGEVTAKRKLEETEAFLLNAISVADLGTWSIDLPTGNFYYSERIAKWFGFGENEQDIERALDAIVPEDRDRIKVAIAKAFDSTQQGTYDEEYTVQHLGTGRRRLLRAQGKTIFSEEGVPLKLVGTAKDVTVEKKLLLEMENRIRLRTEELAAIVEELHSSNDNLSYLNAQLSRSNDELQRFAHVASHDLREPLRKIKTFLNRIQMNRNEPVSDQALQYMSRVNAAADRMFDMIKGVLTYSTVNAGEQHISSVDVNQVVKSVLVDLELLLTQTNAMVEMSPLPSIEGARVLIHQLFYNLIGNALKFKVSGRAPIIRIDFEEVIIEGNKMARITVSDNGIGFDQQHAEKIFQTFTRLQSKDKYEGTGLGLALCRSITERHGGWLKAEGIPNEGASFIVTLPFTQQKSRL